MQKPIKVGLMGYGYASKTFHAPLIQSVPGFELVAVSSSDPGKVLADWPSLAVLPSPDELLARPDLDLIVIPTPNESHFPLAQAALAAGKHVVVDKPFTVSLAEARSLQKQADTTRQVLSVFHNRRWDADFLTLRQVIASGELGPIVHFESHFDRYRPAVRARWREQALPGSGLWYDLGSHLVDQCLQLFGRPDSIGLDVARQRNNALADDWFHAVLRYGQSRCLLHASALVPSPAARFTVHGQRGSFLKYGLDPQEDALKAGSFPPAVKEAGSDWGVDTQSATLTCWPNGVCQQRTLGAQDGVAGDYPAYYHALRDAIWGKGPNPVSAAEACEVIELLELGVQSVQEARVIAVLRT